MQKQIRIPIYIGINIVKNGFFATIKDGRKYSSVSFAKCTKKDLDKKIYSWLNKYTIKNKVKIIGVGIVGHHNIEKLISDLWFK